MTVTGLGGDQAAMGRHFVAVSTNLDGVTEFGRPAALGALAAANQGSGPTASRSSFHDLQRSAWSGRGRAGGSGRRPGSVR
jgi:hypothetical protein